MGEGTNCRGKQETFGAMELLHVLTVVVVIQLQTIIKLYLIVHLNNVVGMKPFRGVTSQFRNQPRSQAVFEYQWFPVSHYL